MKKWSFLIIVLLFCFNLNVKAANTCSSSEMARLKNLAEKIEFTYDYEWETFYYDEKEDDTYRRPNFTITATNLNKELKVMIEEDYLNGNYKEFKNNGSNIGSVGGFLCNDSIVITIRAYTLNECSGKVITTKKIKLPDLNAHYYTTTCKQYPDFKYCSQFTDELISDDKFANELVKYVNGENSTNNSNDENDIIQNISSDYYIIIGIFLIVIFIIVLIILVKKKKNNSL